MFTVYITWKTVESRSLEETDYTQCHLSLGSQFERIWLEFKLDSMHTIVM